MFGLRGKSVLIVLMMVVTIITLALGLVNYVAQQISIKLGKEFAIQHSQRYKAEMGVALEHDLRLTQQLAKNHSIIAWMQNEQDTQLKQQSMPVLANYLSVINSDSWFVAPQSSQNFYYNNKSNIYADGRLVKKLEADQPLDAWFFHTINSVAPFNLNIDYDPAINETKLWINMPVEHEGRRIGVVGAGFDFATFINRYVSSRQAGFRAMVLSRSGAILAKDGEMRTTFNLHTSPPDSWLRLWHLLDDAADQKRLEDIFDQVSKSNKSAVSFELALEGKTYIAAAKRGEQVLPQTLELEQPCKGGGSVWTEAIGQVVKSEQGELRIIGVTRDISERRKDEETMRKLAHYDSLTDCVKESLNNSRFFSIMTKFYFFRSFLLKNITFFLKIRLFCEFWTQLYRY